MKFAGYLIIAVSLVIGVLGAVTAYLPRLSLPDDRLIGLTLAANAGRFIDASGESAPIARAETVITSELLQSLREAGVHRIKVKEFALNRWSGWWMFLLGCAGLIGGALMMRCTRPAATTTHAEEAHGTPSPGQTLRNLIDRVTNLQSALPSLDHGAAAARVLEDIGAVQRDLIAAFIAARPRIIAERGLTGFAQVMDAFAAAERQLNRAWSAAADDVVEEAIACIDRAVELLHETRHRLEGTAAATE